MIYMRHGSRAGPPPPVFPIYEGTGGLVNRNGAGNMNVAYPDENPILTGDMLLLVNSSYIGTPVGAFGDWELIADPAGADDMVHKVLAIFAVGGETGNLTLAVNGTLNWSVMYHFRGAASVSNNTQDTRSTQTNAPSVTTPGANHLAIAIFAGYSTVVPGDISGESGGAWVLRHAEKFAGFESTGLYTCEMPTAGAISGGTANTGFGTWSGIYMAP